MNGAGITGAGITAATRAPTFLLHGVFAVQDARRGYTLVEVQQGVVTAVEPNAVTVTSPDGYARRYPLTSTTAVGSVTTATSTRIAPGSRVIAMVTPDGELHLTDLGEPPVDGSRLSALVPVVPSARRAGARS